MNADARIAPRIVVEDGSAPLRYCVILFLCLFAYIASPALFSQFYSTAEEQVSIFGGAYGLRLFYPGSNRIMMVIPLITSWLQTPGRIMVAHFLFNALSISLALTIFARALPRKLFFPFCLALLAAITVIFGGGMYQFHLSVVQPYLASTALGLLCTTVLLTTSRTGIVYALQLVGLFVLTLAAAGINPSVALLFMAFFGLNLLVALGTGVPWRTGVLSAGRHVVGALGRSGNLLAGLALNLAATAVVFFSYGWYKSYFPQYVKSNYSVESYMGSGLSAAELVNAFGYMISFHDGAGLLGPLITRCVIVAVLMSGILSFVLWRHRRIASPQLAKFYLLALLLWISAMLVVVVLSQNAHIQLVPNLIRGRYFTSAYYVMILALCLTAATAAVEMFGKRQVWRHLRPAMLAVAIFAVVGSFVAHIANWGMPRYAILKRNAEIEAVAAQIKAAKVPVVLGNYWWIWDIQYALNESAARVPSVTPIAIRTESFGLNVFTPMLTTLARGKAVQFMCVELKRPTPGLEEACAPQIASFRFQSGFPTGEITELSHSETEDFKLTLYELSLTNPADPDDCTASQILLRAKPVAATVPGQDSYLLEEDSFVHLQRPGARADWVLRFTQDDREEVMIVPNAKQSYFHLLNHRISVLGAGCRLLVTVSRRDRLFPSTMKLDVR